mgnify:CR=1 FL=1
MTFSDNTKTEIQIRKFKARLILIFFVVITITVGIVSFIITRKSSDEMQNKVVNLVAQGNRQQINNVNSYLGKIEDTAALLFSDDLYYEFDATAQDLDAFEKLQTEKTIKDRLDDLGILENFSDFGIVYADDSTIGWISNTTIQLFPNGGLFSYLDNNINNSKTESGWFFDYSKCYDRLYYVKRLNKNAILITAFYSRELSDALTASDSMSELRSYLVDGDYNILYSDDEKSIGKNAVDVITDVTTGYDNYQLIGDENLIVQGKCENNWSIICTAPVRVIFSEEKQLENFSLVVTIVMLIAILLGGTAIFIYLSRSGGVLYDIKNKADYDQLTQVLNRNSLLELVDRNISQSAQDTIHVLIMMDMDNFKKVNDTLGHNAGDHVLKHSAELFSDIFSEYAVVGRMGGDEFTIYMERTDETVEQVMARVEQDIQRLFHRFQQAFHEKYKECDLSLSAGAYISVKRPELNCNEMYKKADKALYISKENGKNQLNWYEEI